jgi:hypothetical protein
MITGAPWNGQVNHVSRAVYPQWYGDLCWRPGQIRWYRWCAGVVVNGQDVSGMPTVAVAAAGDTLRGVVVGFLPKQSDLTVLHREASTNRIALVVDDPERCI